MASAKLLLLLERGSAHQLQKYGGNEYGPVAYLRSAMSGNSENLTSELSLNDSLASSIAHEIDIRSLVPNEIAHVSSRTSLHPGMFDISALPHRDHRTLLDGCVPDLVDYRSNSPGLQVANCLLRRCLHLGCSQCRHRRTSAYHHPDGCNHNALGNTAARQFNILSGAQSRLSVQSRIQF